MHPDGINGTNCSAQTAPQPYDSEPADNKAEDQTTAPPTKLRQGAIPMSQRTMKRQVIYPLETR